MGVVYDKILGRVREADENGGGGGGGGGSVIIDDELSPTSGNPVANSVLYEAINDPFTTIATSTDATFTVAPGTASVWTPNVDGTLTVSGGVAGKRSYAMIDIVLGASNTVTLSGITWMSSADALVSSATNRCVVIFDGTSATISVC